MAHSGSPRCRKHVARRRRPPLWGAAGHIYSTEDAEIAEPRAAFRPQRHKQVFSRSKTAESRLGPSARPSAGLTPASPSGQQPLGRAPDAVSWRSAFAVSLSTWCGTTSWLLPRGLGVCAWTLHQAPQVPAAPDVWRREHLQPTEVLSARFDGREKPGALVGREAPTLRGGLRAFARPSRLDRAR